MKCHEDIIFIGLYLINRVTNKTFLVHLEQSWSPRYNSRLKIMIPENWAEKRPPLPKDERHQIHHTRTSTRYERLSAGNDNPSSFSYFIKVMDGAQYFKSLFIFKNIRVNKDVILIPITKKVTNFLEWSFCFILFRFVIYLATEGNRPMGAVKKLWDHSTELTRCKSDKIEVQMGNSSVQ